MRLLLLLLLLRRLLLLRQQHRQRVADVLDVAAHHGDRLGSALGAQLL